eukprot:4357994-Pleurochrysis_carterae.AAC.1
MDWAAALLVGSRSLAPAAAVRVRVLTAARGERSPVCKACAFERRGARLSRALVQGSASWKYPRGLRLLLCMNNFAAYGICVRGCRE